MLQIITAFEILPIKPDFNKKQVKKATKNILFRYMSINVANVKSEELKEILSYKYEEIFKTANSTLNRIQKGEISYDSQEDYDAYVDFFKRNLNDLNNEDLIIILEANELETTGNKTQLIDRIIDKVPSAVASLNFEEHSLREEYEDIKDILREFPDNKLVRILELKNIIANGNSETLINKIDSNIDKNEIYTLIEQIDREIDDFKVKLNGLRDDQLRLILKNNNFNARGEKNLLINKIIKNVPLSEMENNINGVRIN